ncbi:MAG: glycosyltransferase WbpY [Dehalococcoidia bacterium]|nr:glycosyltransferase WbpY [Dehalococcoidia bacterium]
MRVSINAYFLQQPFTGSGQYVRHLLPALARVEPALEAVPLLPSSPAEHPSTAPLASTGAQIVGLPGWLSHPDLRKVWWEQVSLTLASRGLAADVAHVPYFAPPLWTTRRLVVTIHDLIPLILPEYVTRPHVRVYNILAAVAARRAARIIADSHSTASDIEHRLGITADRIDVVPLAASPTMKPMPNGTGRQAIMQRLGLDRPFVFYIGGFDARKNVPSLLRAFHALPGDLRRHHVLAIAGEQPAHNPRLFPPLRPLTEALGLGSQVRFLGRVTEEEKQALYSAATLFVFPSVYEGFGLDPLEAMACGAPVLSSNLTSLPEVVRGGAALIDPTNHDAFTRELATLLDSPGRRLELRRLGSAVAATFSWDRTAVMTAEAYRQACESR